MVLSTFISFNNDDKERIDRFLNETNSDIFFDSIIYDKTTNINLIKKYCLVGFSYSSKLFDLDITNNYISNDREWLFSYEEDKSFFKKSLNEYIKKSFIEFTNNYNYQIIDCSFNKELFCKIRHFIFSKILLTDKSIYFLCENENTIYNISLKMIKFFYGIDGVKKVINFFKKFNNVINDNKRIHFNNMRNIINEDILDDVFLERYLITLI